MRIQSNNLIILYQVSSIFAIPRGWLAGSPTVPRETKKRAMDALFVMAYHGNLIEYYLEPVPATTIPKVTDDSLIELKVNSGLFTAMIIFILLFL